MHIAVHKNLFIGACHFTLGLNQRVQAPAAPRLPAISRYDLCHILMTVRQPATTSSKGRVASMTASASAGKSSRSSASTRCVAARAKSSLSAASDPVRTVRFICAEEKKTGGTRRRNARQDLEDFDMTHAVDQKFTAWPEAPGCKHVAAEPLGIGLDPLLTEILQRLAGVGIAARAENLGSQIVSKACSWPAEGCGNR